MAIGGGVLEADHGASHALAGSVGELGCIERDLTAEGAPEQRKDVVAFELFGFDGAAEVGVEGVARGERESGGTAMPDSVRKWSKEAWSS